MMLDRPQSRTGPAAPSRNCRRRSRRFGSPRPAMDLHSTQFAPVAAIPEVIELNIGHFLIGEAIFAGLHARGRSDANDHPGGSR